MRRGTGKFTYANVMATIAVFIALGGGAYAAGLGKNSVGSKQLKKNSVTGVKVRNGSLTDKDIDVSSLGRVPGAATATTAGSAAIADRATTAANADTLDGRPASAFAQASRFVSGSASTVPTSPQTIITIPGAFRVTTVGTGVNSFYPRYENISTQTWRFIQPNSGYVTPGPGKAEAQEISPGTRVALILAQNVTDPTKFVYLLCGFSDNEKTTSCQATIPPNL